ncbi:MAG TPA: methyltransferase domain-containing protein [Candidatus Saccharimonadales bacterium]|nr:methyltransferase domain-containing protein [Candidatus Saccharimonadales bacterium]
MTEDPPVNAEVVPAAGPTAEPSSDIAEYDLRYRDVFWAGRGYEDRCDRIAIRALLPPRGERLVEIAAGFGRLIDEYTGYASVTLFDASSELLGAARDRLGSDPRLEFIPGDAHRLPFPDASFDAVVCVRAVHNFADPATVFAEFARVLRPGGVLVLEFANKRHLKSIARWVLRRQCWSPFSPEPHEYRPLHFDRSPAQVKGLLRAAGFRIGPVRAVSLFRLGAVTSRLSPGLLASVEAPLQAPLGPLAIGPSVYLRARRPRA